MSPALTARCGPWSAPSGDRGSRQLVAGAQALGGASDTAARIGAITPDPTGVTVRSERSCFTAEGEVALLLLT
jgi:hypothetical protein